MNLREVTMAKYLKRAAVVLLSLAFLCAVLLLPVFPWSARCRYALNRVVVKAEMRLAKWRGAPPRLVSLSGKVSIPAAQIQAIDSRSGWATLADREGNFILPEVMWYPGASYDLVVTSDAVAARLVRVVAPRTYPATGVLDVGELDLNAGREISLANTLGLNSVTYDNYDHKNEGYYKDLFDSLTAQKQSDQQKIEAINDYVATKLNYEETKPEMGSPRLVLERGSQYCGHLTTAMAAILGAGGYKHRRVTVIDDADRRTSHAVVEVFYEGEWHLFDPTFGVAFKDARERIVNYRDLRLDQSPISEDLFSKFKPKFRRRLLSWMPNVYKTGFHHCYQFKSR
jgi:transglutaminase superfamily protein